MDRETKLAILNGQLCPYCLTEPSLVNREAVYGEGHDYGRLWACLPCRAWVGCHGSGTKPLGRLADRRLRRWKRAAHEAFDPLWRHGPMTRGEAYVWLAAALGIDPTFCHVGMMSVRYCRRTTRLSSMKAAGNDPVF